MDCRAEFETFAVLKSRTCKAEIIRNSVSGVRWNIDHSPQSVYFRHTRLFKEMLCFQHHTFVSSTASRYSSCFFKKKNLKIVCFKRIVENSFVDIVIIPDVGWRACSPYETTASEKEWFLKAVSLCTHIQDVQTGSLCWTRLTNPFGREWFPRH